MVCRYLFFLLALATARADEAFLGPIPVQEVAPGSQLILDFHRFYQPAGRPDLKFDTPPGVELAFDRVSLQLRALAKNRGLYDVVIKSGKASTVLTLSTTAAAPTQHFVFKPEGSGTVTKVFLAGSFNGWSKDKTPMSGPDQKGEFTADLPLPPGHYSYKFVVDDKWTADSRNPATEDNGMGDKNSVIEVTGEKREEHPTIYADAIEHGQLTLRTAGTAAVAKVSAVLETESGATLTKAEIRGDRIVIPAKEADGVFVRVVAATSDGTASNVVRCALSGRSTFQWHDAVMYYAFTDRFLDGDKSNDHPVADSRVLPPANFHGGDLRGIRDQIDDGYFQSLGVNTVWVAPLNRNPATAYREYPEPHRWYTGYHGYWPVSATELDPHIGTKQDLRELVEHAHARGMKVIADLVLHHVHEEHPWWKEHRDWFGSLDLPDGRKNLRLWDEQQFTTWFEPYLPSFDFTKDAPVRALIDNSIWWLNTYQLDGFRLDAVKHILPSFWWKFRAALRTRVDRHGRAPLYLVGETFKDRAGIMQFVGPNMLDGQFDFPLYDQIKDSFALGQGDMKALDDSLGDSERVYGKETLMSPLVGNHDKGRFMAYADGDLPDAKIEKEEEVGWDKPPKVDDPDNYKKLELAQTFLMSIDGVPMVYYGDEIGMTGAGDPDNRRDMRFGDQVSPDETRVLENFKKLGKIRQTHPALRYGSRRTVRADGDVYAFVRAYLDDRLVVVFNRGTSAATIDLPVAPELGNGECDDLIGSAQARIDNGKLTCTLLARSAAIFAPSGKVSPR